MRKRRDSRFAHDVTFDVSCAVTPRRGGVVGKADLLAEIRAQLCNCLYRKCVRITDCEKKLIMSAFISRYCKRILWHCYFKPSGRDSSVGGVDNWGFLFRFQARARAFFSLFQMVNTGSGARPASLSVGFGVSLPWDKAVGSWIWSLICM